MRVNDRMNWLYKKCDYHDFVIHILHIKIIHFQCLFHSIVPSCNKFLDTASDTYHHMYLKLSSFSINIWSMPNFFARFTFLLIMAITFLCVIIVAIVLSLFPLLFLEFCMACCSNMRTIPRFGNLLPTVSLLRFSITAMVLL